MNFEDKKLSVAKLSIAMTRLLVRFVILHRLNFPFPKFR